MKIVILCDTYYPHINPAANCIERYIPYLTEDNDITIVCPATVLNKDAVIKDGTRIEFISCLWNDLRSYCREREENGTANGLTKVVYKLVRAWGVFLSYFKFPSRFAWYKKAYYRKLNKINKEKKIDVIVSVSDPVCAHLAALKFKKKNPSVRWVSYSTDPYSENPTLYKNIYFKSCRKNKNLKTESQIYNTADYSILTEELIAYAMNLSPSAQSKMYCFPYVLSPIVAQKPGGKGEEHDSSEFVNLVYAGSLREKVRNPETLLSIAKNCNGIHLWLYTSGDCEHLFKKYESDNITVSGLLPKEQYLSILLNKADVLVNICNTIDLQAPSKMLELLSTGKPVINFYYKQDSFYRMIEKYPLGLNVKQGDAKDIRRVEKFCQETKGKKLIYEDVARLFPNNTIGNQVTLLKSMISGVL